MNDPRTIIDTTAMNPRQWIVIVLMVVLNALDGFDVLSSAFAAPGITKEWGIERSALGVVLSAITSQVLLPYSATHCQAICH